jgi:hypothetical protein
MPEMKWTRNVRIEGCRRAGARPQELRLPRALAQARRTELLLGFELEELVVTVRIAHPSPRLSTVWVALEGSPAESRDQGAAEPTKRTRQSARAVQIRRVSGAIGSIHGVVATFVISFSHASTEWSTYETPLCPVMKWPIGQVKCAWELDRNG